MAQPSTVSRPAPQRQHEGSCGNDSVPGATACCETFPILPCPRRVAVGNGAKSDGRNELKFAMFAFTIVLAATSYEAVSCKCRSAFR